MKKQAIQDGAEFYDVVSGDCVDRYPNLVAYDYDMHGAMIAREQFLADHPEYEMSADPFS